MRRRETRITRFALCLLILWSLGHTAPVAARQGTAISRLARILLTFTHVPTVAQHEALQSILHDSGTTAAERVIATALMNMEHIVSLEDRPKLHTLISDETAPASVRTLASILDHMTHAPTDVDKQKLRQLLKQTCRK